MTGYLLLSPSNPPQPLRTVKSAPGELWKPKETPQPALAEILEGRAVAMQ